MDDVTVMPADTPAAVSPHKPTGPLPWRLIAILILATSAIGLGYAYYSYKPSFSQQHLAPLGSELITVPALAETRFQGRITEITPLKATNGFRIVLQNVTPNAPQQMAVYEYSQTVINTAELNQLIYELKPFDRIDITEWSDLTSTLNSGLVAVQLSRPQLDTTEPYNSSSFNIITHQYRPAQKKLYQRIFNGKIMAINNSNEGQTVSITLDREVGDKVPATELYAYPARFIKNLSSLKVGDTISIIETNDYSKNYQDSIVDVIITKQ